MNIIVAIEKNNGMGYQNKIPWYLKNDLKHFSSITTSQNSNKNVVIMGRKTWESIPSNYRPLKNRINIILTKNNENVQVDSSMNDCFIKNSLQHALDFCNSLSINEIFIIGGSQLYNEAINHKLIKNLYITEIYRKFDCDTFFPSIDSNLFELVSVSKFMNESMILNDSNEDVHYRFLKYQRINDNKVLPLWQQPHSEPSWKNYEEYQYLDMLRYILDNGIERNDRTNVGTISTFGKQFTYDLSDTFPLLTTKKMFTRAIFEELALYISGSTDNKILQEKNIHIWDGNTTREFLDSRGLTDYEEGDMGETYGFNFRHYGEVYEGCQYDYYNLGFDQLNYVVDQIRTNPTSRRIIINLWNAATMHKAALPACLCMYQFYVDTKNNKLNLQIYIRSSDFFLANNWNTCTGAFLVHMICNLKDINLTPGNLSVITGDTHLYLSHIDAVKQNLEREPRPYPKLVIKEQKDKLEDYTWSDFKIIGYNPYPNISAPMAV